MAAALIAVTGSTLAQRHVLKFTAPDAEPHGYLRQARLSPTVLLAATPAIGTELGALYVFERTSGELRWKLRPAEAELDDAFGMAVAVHGRYAVVGAPERNLQGAAHLFDVREGRELATLLPSDALSSVDFGASVALDAQNVVVGAPGIFLFPPYSGAVYVFDRSSFGLLRRFAPQDLSSGGFFESAYFGAAVSADGGRVLAGAPGDAGVGSAYVFEVSTGTRLHKWLPPADPAPLDFGWSVDLHGDLAAVGDNSAEGYLGAAHVFDVASGALRFTVQAPDGEAGDGFGMSIAVDERILAVGAPYDDDAPFTGSVYVFRSDTGELVGKLHGFPAHTTHRFGTDVDIFEGALAVGDSQDSEAAIYAGAAFVVPLAPHR